MNAPLDKLKLFPDELTSGCNGFCVGFTVADLIGNRIGQPCDIPFSFALGIYMGNLTPTTAGEDPKAGMIGGMCFGALPLADDLPSETLMSQLEKANIANYTGLQRQEAQQFAQNGVTSLLTFSEITNYLDKSIGGVSLVMKWYESFMQPNPDGTLPAPGGSYSLHNVSVWSHGPLGLLIKPFINPGNQNPPTWGVNGYCWLPEFIYNEVELDAYGFSPSAWRWLSLVYAALSYPPRIPQIRPLLGK